MGECSTKLEITKVKHKVGPRAAAVLQLWFAQFASPRQREDVEFPSGLKQSLDWFVPAK